MGSGVGLCARHLLGLSWPTSFTQLGCGVQGTGCGEGPPEGFLLLEHSSEAWREGLWQADMALGGGGAQGESEGESLGRRR